MKLSKTPKRPERNEFVQLFFPELQQQNTKADRDAYIRLSLSTCEAILRDFVKAYDKGLAKHGPGVLVIRLRNGLAEAKDGAEYVSADDLRQDLATAERHGHTSLHGFLKDAVKAAESVNSEVFAAVMLIDNSSSRVYYLSKSDPSGDVRAMLEEAAK